MTTKEKFIEMAKNITRPGIDEMMAWLETTDFYDAPASTRFHGSQAGEMRNRKNSAGMWEQVPFYQFAPKESVGGDNHGSLSCQRIMEHGIRLTQEEYGAVNNHMGVTNSANSSGVWQCYEMYTLSWLLHVADEAATVIDKI